MHCWSFASSPLSDKQVILGSCLVYRQKQLKNLLKRMRKKRRRKPMRVMMKMKTKTPLLRRRTRKRSQRLRKCVLEGLAGH